MSKLRKEVSSKNKQFETKSGNNGRRRRSNYRSQDSHTQAMEREESTKDYPNNPSWYYSDKDLMDQVSTFSFNQFLEEDGRPFNGTSIFSESYVPSIMRLDFNPSPGFTLGNSTADGGINIAAMKLYTKLSSMNAKTTQYAPQDVATLMLAIGELVSQYEFIKRCFRIVFLYNVRNRNVPRLLLTSCGVKYDDFVQHIADYRLEFNATVNMINQIAFPGDVPYFEKCASMYSHIYTESESPMSQMYVFCPGTSWIVDETTFEEGTVLSTIGVCNEVSDNSSRTRTMADYIADLRSQIQAILNSATFNYIYADVLRIVDPSKLLTMPYVVEGEGIAPEFDPMMLLQINNLTMIGFPNGAGSETRTPRNDVYPKVENNALFYAPAFNLPNEGAIALSETILNFPHSMGHPDIDQRVESTRLVILGDYDNESANEMAIPDHYCTCLRIITKWEGTTWYSANAGYSVAAGYSWLNDSGKINNITKFDYAPRFYSNNSTTGKINNINGDLDYFTNIDVNYLKKVNDLAITNLFSCMSILGNKSK